MFWASITEMIYKVLDDNYKLCKRGQWGFVSTHSLLEFGQVSRAQSVSFGNDGDQVDTRAESLHDLNVERLQGMASRANEVQAGVDTEINLVLAARLLLLKHVGFVLVVEELDDGHPGVTVVDVVTESGCVNDGEADYSR